MQKILYFLFFMFGVAVGVCSFTVYKKARSMLDIHVESVFDKKAKTLEDNITGRFYKYGILQ